MKSFESVDGYTPNVTPEGIDTTLDAIAGFLPEMYGSRQADVYGTVVEAHADSGMLAAEIES